METPDPASVPPHPVEHPQRAGMDRQRLPVAGDSHPADVDRRRLKAMIENHRASTDVRLGADRNRRSFVAGDKVAATGVGLIQRRLTAVRFENVTGQGAGAA